ncbi:MAG: type II toxin-antitoxin system CcdA family antitoxin [Gammaproteobacteria bacterium]
MLTLYDIHAPKKAANLSVNSDLLKKAKDLDINLSAALEQILAELIKTKQQEAWLKENRKSIERYNCHVEEHGVFSDGLRGF